MKFISKDESLKKEFCDTPIKDRVFGARALNQLSTHIKAIALRNDENSVTDYHHQLFCRFFHYFNYNCPLILPRKETLSLHACREDSYLGSNQSESTTIL